MAEGPHSSDVVHRYLQQVMETVYPTSEAAEVLSDDAFSGEETWEVEDVELSNLMEDRANGENVLRKPTYGFQALDQIFGAVKTTQNGNKKLEGLRAFRIPWDTPIDQEGRSWGYWTEEYDNAGLIPEQGSTHDVDPTPEGDIFLDIDPRQYDTKDIGVEEIGEFYKTLSSQGYGTSKENNGRKVEAFFLYGAGLEHTEISNRTGIPESTARSMAGKLQDMGLMRSDYRLTEDGEKLGEMMLDQIDALETATVDRVEEEYGSWSGLDVSEFAGNPYMAEALRSRHV